MKNEETRKLQTALDKRHHIMKNELKTHQNLRIIDDRRFIRDKEEELKKKKKESKKF